MTGADDFSPEALFPELTEAQRLGFYTDRHLDLGATYADAVAMLERLADDSPDTDADGYAWLIHASARDDDRQRLAWVEWRMRERGLHEDHDFYLKARDGAGKLRVWQIETDNPYFGCPVQSLAWDGGDVVLVYADNHTTWEARLGPDGPARRQEAARDEIACQLTPADIQAVPKPSTARPGVPATGAATKPGGGCWPGWRWPDSSCCCSSCSPATSWAPTSSAGTWWPAPCWAAPRWAPGGRARTPPCRRPTARSTGPSPCRWKPPASGSGARASTTTPAGTRSPPCAKPAAACSSPPGWAAATSCRVLPSPVPRPPTPSSPVSRRCARPWSTRRRGALFYLLLFPALFLLGLLIEGQDDTAWLLGFAAGLFAVWLLTRAILLIDRRLAIARFPLPEGETELQRWGDHLRVSADGQTKRTGYDQLGNVVATPEHVFLVTGPDYAIIVPRRAFADADAMAAFAAKVDDASNHSVP